MYSRKSVGPRIESWGTSALTGYSSEDFPSRTTRSRLLLTKEEIGPNDWPEILRSFLRSILRSFSNIAEITRQDEDLSNSKIQSNVLLTHFWRIFPFYTPWKHQKTNAAFHIETHFIFVLLRKTNNWFLYETVFWSFQGM